jgi:hypothetical protein
MSFSHRRVDCRLPTHCFNFHGFRNHLRDCKHPQKSLALHVLGGSKAYANADGRHSDQARRDASCACPASQALCCTLPSLGGGDGLASLAPSVTCGFPEPALAFPVASACFIPRSLDHMVDEAVKGAMVDVPLHSCHENVADTVNQLANPPPIAMSPCLSNFRPPFEDIQTPVMVRSEEEQLVGHTFGVCVPMGTLRSGTRSIPLENNL